jgi:glutamate-ammonia-ligase adenylyltransferase
MDFKGAAALSEFDTALLLHRGHVRRVFERVFREQIEEVAAQSAATGQDADEIIEREATLARTVAKALSAHVAPDAIDPEGVARIVSSAASHSLNPHRALTLLTRITASLEKTDEPLEINLNKLGPLVRLCGTSEFFGELIASNPRLIDALAIDITTPFRHDFRAALRAAIDQVEGFSNELSALRRQWSRLLLEVGQRDAGGVLSSAESNRLQNELAVASLNVAYLCARREIVRRFGNLSSGPRIAILGLGRLGTGGLDYGSDLDIIIVYDALVPSPLKNQTKDEFYARLGELMLGALSSVTREGYLYRVDLRLRPNGKSGPLVVSSDGFLDYAKAGADIWEWLAYVKLRAVAGDLELGKMVETHARHAIHERARQASGEELRVETRRVRERLKFEKGRVRPGELDIKYAAGGMLDVYFATRYLQLREDVPDEGSDRSTPATLERLAVTGALEEMDYETLSQGYVLLRSLDHQLRLAVGRSARLPAPDHPVAKDVAARLGFESADDLRAKVCERMKEITEAYERITG